MSLVRPEYPRPHFDRSHTWLSLNGSWEFATDPAGTATVEELSHEDRAWPSRITVPFAWETEASGLGVHWLEYGWYRRTITIPEEWSGQRVVLHFGAVHHSAVVWVNGTRVGEHEGGYTPFEFDITDTLDGLSATVLVRVWAPVDKREIVHGKQRSIPRDDYDSCAFTPSSGIWQSVWLEARPATYVSALALAPSDTLDGIVANVTAAGPSLSGARLTVSVDGGRPVTTELDDGTVRVHLRIQDPRLWSPADPHLYTVTVTLESADGTDRVASQTGLRRVTADGEHILLNDERLYVRGVLDQGYWPRTGLTAPDDQAFVTDLELAREAGFNLVRKHLKLEDPRFLHHADRLGMLVWAEPASTGVFTPAAVARFEAQIEPMVRRDGNHPSVVIWGLYNEEWGLDWDVPGDPDKQAAVRRAYESLKNLDPSRPVVDNSGWSHVATDLVDWHIYDETPAGWATKVHALLAERRPAFPVGLGPGMTVDKLLMADGGPSSGRPNLNSEFGGGWTSVERGWNLRWQTLELRRHDDLSGYVWTELYDIEHEMAGVYAFDRSRKDGGGNAPDLVNAETVLLVDIDPRAPGRDLVVGDDRTVDVGVRISHHGSSAIEAVVVPVWGAVLGDCDAAAASRAVGATPPADPVKVHPFRLSAPFRVVDRLPDGVRAARLHLLIVSADEVVGRCFVDVGIDAALDAAARATT
ncbi:glycoside hydrolase family 2 protein [Actinoallomurus soli]|uniref:glycoside hydrolase family 2 protein n=1 Tax=Actinoallomurus soli TaxID=2952535 RepID=UPI002112201F|nr:sugar-binding domain-containing protein [Actinoallomurus soli]